MLKQAYGLLHPKLFTLAKSPSDDESMICMENDRLYFQNMKNTLLDNESDQGNNSYFKDCFDNDSDTETDAIPQPSTSRATKRRFDVRLDISYDTVDTECSTPKRPSPSTSLTIVTDANDDTSEDISDIPGFNIIQSRSITEFFKTVTASQIENIAQSVKDTSNDMPGNLEQYIAEKEYHLIPDEDEN